MKIADCKFVFAALAAILALAGCAVWPSTWRLGGSALDKNERAQAKLGTAQDAANRAGRDAVHQASLAAVHLPPSRPAAVVQDFLAEAQSLLDQANGAPAADAEAGWRELVAGLISENATIRTAAEKQRAADAETTADLAHRLAAATAAAERANARALDYARDREALADFAAKIKLGFFALVGLLVLGTVLSIAARFVPALGLAAKAVNGVVAPAIAYAAHRAEEGLQRVGTGIAGLRRAGALTEAQIAQHLDGVTDRDHQRLIAAGAVAAGAPPPAA